MRMHLFQRMQEKRLDKQHYTLGPGLAEKSTSSWKGPAGPREGNTG